MEVTVPLDTNLQKAYKEKQIKYIHLITRLQQLYKNYKYTTIIINVGALGAIPKLLEENLKKLYAEDRIPVIIQRIQKAAYLVLSECVKQYSKHHEEQENSIRTVDLSWTRTIIYLNDFVVVFATSLKARD